MKRRTVLTSLIGGLALTGMATAAALQIQTLAELDGVERLRPWLERLRRSIRHRQRAAEEIQDARAHRPRRHIDRSPAADGDGQGPLRLSRQRGLLRSRRHVRFRRPVVGSAGPSHRARPAGIDRLRRCQRYRRQDDRRPARASASASSRQTRRSTSRTKAISRSAG